MARHVRNRFGPSLDSADLISSLEERTRVRDARAARVVARLEKLTSQRARLAWRIGRALSELLRERLHYNTEQLSFNALLAHLGFGRSQAFKLIAIAERLTEDEAAELGVEAAYARALASNPADRKKQSLVKTGSRRRAPSVR